MAQNKIYKFRDLVEMQHYLNGGVLGAEVAGGIRGLVGRTVTFKAPGPAGSVTFVAPSSPPDGDPTILRLGDIKDQIENQIAGLKVLCVGGKLAIIEATPTNGVTVAADPYGGYAVVNGTADLDDIAYGSGGDLDTLELKLKHNNGSILDIIFAAPVNRQDVVDQINAVTSPGIVARVNTDGTLRLTSQNPGSSDSIQVVASSALTTLGLTAGSTSGSSTNTANGLLGFSSTDDVVGKLFKPVSISTTPPCWVWANVSLDNAHVINTWE